MYFFHIYIYIYVTYNIKNNIILLTKSNIGRSVGAVLLY